MTTPIVWGIHMGKHVGHAPVEDGYIAIGGAEAGDPSQWPDSLEAYRNRLRAVHPSESDGRIGVWAGVMRRFTRAIAVGDIVVYPSKIDRMVNVGRVDGPARFEPGAPDGYPNRRAVTWLAHVPRDRLPQSALYEIGSALTLFQVKTHKENFLALIGAQSATATKAATAAKAADDIATDDDGVTEQVAQQAEEGAADFVIRRLMTGLSGAEFEEFVAHLLQCMGYKTRLTPVTGDGGVDIIAHTDPLGFQPPIVKVQCKRTTAASPEADINQLLGTLGDGEFGLFVTLGSFSRSARITERGRPKLRLIDGTELVQLVFEHYPKFDSRFRAAIPLKQVYLPDVNSRD